MTQMVFLPARRSDAVRLREGPWAGEQRAFTATPALRRAVAGPGADEPDPEELDFAATTQAGIAALLDPTPDTPLRFVIALELPDRQIRETDEGLGAVGISGAVWSSVRAIFSDEPAAAAAVAAARNAARGHTVDSAAELPEVRVLLDCFDLLWYDPAEVDTLPS